MRPSRLLMLTAAAVGMSAAPALADVEKPAALVADGSPAIPDALAAATRPYLEFRTASFSGWNPLDRSMLIATRFGNTAQLHRVAAPGADRRQISFEAEPVSGGSYAPRRGDVLLVQKDVGGNEFYQIYALKDGRLQLLTDGKSRNGLGAWTHDGRMIGYSSTRRNGTDTDLYVMDPRDPATDRLVARVKGGGWRIADFTPDGRRAVVVEYVSVNKSNIHDLDVATGALRPITAATAAVSYGGASYAPDGTLWVTSDKGSEYKRLGTLDRAGRFTPRSRDPKWDVETFDISDDGRSIAYVTNEAGISRVKLMNASDGATRTVDRLPVGVIGGIDIAPWGTVGLTLSSARSPSDAYAIDPRTLAVTRWTQSETGGLDPRANVEPQLVEVKSFDGEAISGFLYRPDAAKFPGKRPMIVNVHGGPEGQSQPGFQGRNNYYLNELGVAIFYPNVRGSSGYGKRFIALDNGPALRENSVKDIGAYLDVLAADRALDGARVGVTGGSYGGYVCYAAAIRYGARLRGANCSVAISNFITFLENTQSYRRDLRRVEYGDERDPAQRAQLLAISPLTRIGELDIPLMILTGGNDPRVPASEADQVVKAVRANGRTAWHLLGRDEGHGFAKKANQDYAFWTSMMFWRANLLGETKSAAQ